MSLRSILISTHLHLDLPSGLFPSGFPTNILYAFLFSPYREFTGKKYALLHFMQTSFILRQINKTKLINYGALLESPPVVNPLDSFPAFYGTQRFITTFTRAVHLSLS
jgi:hypothetical protein